MRNITRLAARAFLEGREFYRDNTSVVVYDTLCGRIKTLYLHNNVIARQIINDRKPGLWSSKLHITLAGWPTVTTRERLNGLLTELGKREGVWQHKHKQYYGTHEDNIEIDAYEWITV